MTKEQLAICDQINQTQLDVRTAQAILSNVMAQYGLEDTKVDDWHLAYVKMGWRELSDILAHISGMLIDASEDLARVSAAMTEKESGADGQTEGV